MLVGKIEALLFFCKEKVRHRGCFVQKNEHLSTIFVKS